MTFPVVAAGKTLTETSAATTRNLAFPTGTATGDLLIGFFASHDSTTPTATGWTTLTTSVQTTVSVRAAYRIVDGTEGDQVTITSSNIRVSAIVVCITGADGTTAPAFATPQTGSSTSPNPASLNPANWDVEDTLWIAFAGLAATNPPSSYPSNCPDNHSTVVGSSTRAALGFATAESAVASFDPAVFTGNNVVWTAWTLAVRPAPVANATLTSTEARDTISATAIAETGGTLSATEARDTISATATDAAGATLTSTEARDTISATGGELRSDATLTSTEARDTISATAIDAADGTLASTEARDTISAASTLEQKGTLAATEARDIIASTAAVAPLSIGTLDATEARDTISAASTLEQKGTLAATEARDIIDASSTFLVVYLATLSATEARDTISATSHIETHGTLAETEARDTFASTATAPAIATLSGAEARDTISASAELQPIAIATLAATEARDTIDATGHSEMHGSVAKVERRDLASGQATDEIQADLFQVEARDSASISAQTGTVGSVVYLEPRDSVSSGAFAAFLSPTDHLIAAWPLLMPDIELVVLSNAEFNLNDMPAQWVGVNTQGIGSNAVTTNNRYKAEQGSFQVIVFRPAGEGFVAADALARTVARALLGYRTADMVFEIDSVVGPMDLMPDADGGLYGLSLEVAYTLRNKVAA